MAENTDESFIFEHGTLSSDMHLRTIAPRDVQAELLRQSDPKKKIDAFEQELGIAPGQPPKTPPRMKSVILNLDKYRDLELYNNLCNNPRFTIVERNSSWTQRGEFKMFVTYLDNAPEKPPVKPKEEEGDTQ